MLGSGRLRSGDSGPGSTTTFCGAGAVEAFVCFLDYYFVVYSKPNVSQTTFPSGTMRSVRHASILVLLSWAHAAVHAHQLQLSQPEWCRMATALAKRCTIFLESEASVFFEMLHITKLRRPWPLATNLVWMATPAFLRRLWRHACACAPTLPCSSCDAVAATWVLFVIMNIDLTLKAMWRVVYCVREDAKRGQH